MDEPYDLERFVDAQAPVYQRVVAELRQGRKASHWMWFIFPQIKGLGSSPMANKFAIASRAEAQAYLALFAAVANDNKDFIDALDKFYGGKADPATLERL